MYKQNPLQQRGAKTGAGIPESFTSPLRQDNKKEKDQNTKEILESTPSGGHTATSDKILESFTSGKINSNELSTRMALAKKLQRKKDSITVTNSNFLFKRDEITGEPKKIK